MRALLGIGGGVAIQPPEDSVASAGPDGDALALPVSSATDQNAIASQRAESA